MSHRGCHGPCQQGRFPCQTPQACQLEEESGELAWPLLAAVLAVIAIATAFLLAWMLP